MFFGLIYSQCGVCSSMFATMCCFKNYVQAAQSPSIGSLLGNLYLDLTFLSTSLLTANSSGHFSSAVTLSEKKTVFMNPLTLDTRLMSSESKSFSMKHPLPPGCPFWGGECILISDEDQFHLSENFPAIGLPTTMVPISPISHMEDLKDTYHCQERLKEITVGSENHG